MKNMNKIQLAENVVCSMFEINKDQLKSKSRKRNVVRARFTLWRLLYDVMDLSYPAIGRMYIKDHTTVIHGVDEARNQPVVVQYQRFITRFNNSVQAVYNLGTSCGMVTVATEKDTIIHT